MSNNNLAEKAKSILLKLAAYEKYCKENKLATDRNIFPAKEVAALKEKLHENIETLTT